MDLRNTAMRLVFFISLFSAMAFPPLQQAAEGQDYLVPDGAISLPGVQGRLDHLAVDLASQRLFVTGLENHTLEVLSLKERKRLHTVPGIREPQGVVFVPEFSRLLVCSRGDGTCRSFDAATWKEGPWIDVGVNADNLRRDAPSATIFIGSGLEEGPGYLSSIALKSLLSRQEGGVPGTPRSGADLLEDTPRQADLEGQVPLPGHPESFRVAPGGDRIFVNVPLIHAVLVVERKDGQLAVTGTWPVDAGKRNFPMTLDPDGSRLFIACREPARLVAIDTRTGAELMHAPCVDDSDDLFYDAATRRIYMVGGEGYADVFDAAPDAGALTRLAHVPTAAKARTGLFIPELRLLVVAAPHVGEQEASILLFKAP